jgi:Mg-chelatase subunit ChlD
VQSTNFYVDKDSGQFTVIADDNTSSATYKALSNSGNLRSDIGEGGGGAVLGEKKTTATVSGALQLDNKANSLLPPGWASNKVKSAEPADITYNFSALPLPKLLDIYQELVGRTLIYSSAGSLKLPKDVTVAFKTQTPLTRSEAIVALESVMGMNGITIIPVDDKFSKVVAGGVGAEAGLISPKTNFGVIVGPVATPVGQVQSADAPLPQPALPPPVPQPEVETRTNIFSTFSLNVSDAAFKLAQASLQNGVMPDAAGIRSEEFINAFDYRDPEPAPGAPVGFAWERAGYPFAHNRDLLRFSVKTAAQGRQNGRPLNLVLLLDKSGSMERADRVEIIHQALRVLASQLQPQDTLSVVVFARTARLLVDGVAGNQAGDVVNGLNSLTPEGGTNLEEAMKLAYATALRHYLAKGENRVVLLTDGAANLGSVDPEALKRSVAANRKQGIALDCFGVGFDGYNDNMMETLSRTGNGRYGFINTPEEAATEFAGKLAGALRVTASDVKVQLEFNPNRVTSYRQIGYAKHQLTKEQFRDNTVAAAQIGAAESGNALYTVQVNPLGDGPLCTVRVRFRVPGTTDYQEHAWDVPYTGTVVTLDKASPAMRLAATSAAFAEWLASSPYAGEVTPDQLLACLRGVPEVYGADARPKQLEWMIRQAKSMTGK